MNPNEAKEQHKQYCNCKPKWMTISTGQALVCRDGALIWWPTVDTSELDMAHQMALFVAGPIEYDSDGDRANTILLEAGFQKITMDNFEEAKEALRKQLSSELWGSNIRKQQGF